MPSYQFVETGTGRKLYVLNLDAPPKAPPGIAVSLNDPTIPVWTPPREKSEAHKLIDALESVGALTATWANTCRAALAVSKTWT